LHWEIDGKPFLGIVKVRVGFAGTRPAFSLSASSPPNSRGWTGNGANFPKPIGWLFRKPLASSAARIFIRIIAGLFAVVGAIAWTWLLISLAQWGNAMAGAGDGAGTERSSTPPQAILLAAVVWLVPMTGFVFMLFGSLGILKGAWRGIGYWYGLIFWLSPEG